MGGRAKRKAHRSQNAGQLQFPTAGLVHETMSVEDAVTAALKATEQNLLSKRERLEQLRRKRAARSKLREENPELFDIPKRSSSWEKLPEQVPEVKARAEPHTASPGGRQRRLRTTSASVAQTASRRATHNPSGAVKTPRKPKATRLAKGLSIDSRARPAADSRSRPPRGKPPRVRSTNTSSSSSQAAHRVRSDTGLSDSPPSGRKSQSSLSSDAGHRSPGIPVPSSSSSNDASPQPYSRTSSNTDSARVHFRNGSGSDASPVLSPSPVQRRAKERASHSSNTGTWPKRGTANGRARVRKMISKHVFRRGSSARRRGVGADSITDVSANIISHAGTDDTSMSSKCGLCEQATAELFCTHCEVRYCTSCDQKVHKNALAKHERTPWNPGAPALKLSRFCSDSSHSTKTSEHRLTYYCTSCRKPVCTVCAFGDAGPHVDHNCVTLRNAVVSQRKLLAQCLAPLRKMIAKLDMEIQTKQHARDCVEVSIQRVEKAMLLDTSDYVPFFTRVANLRDDLLKLASGDNFPSDGALTTIWE